MRATRAYIASAGTATVMLGASLATFALVSTLVAFGAWPGTGGGRPAIDQVLVSDVMKPTPQAIAVRADAAQIAQRSATVQRAAPASRGRPRTAAAPTGAPAGPPPPARAPPGRGARGRAGCPPPPRPRTARPAPDRPRADGWGRPRHRRHARCGGTRDCACGDGQLRRAEPGADRRHDDTRPGRSGRPAG